MAGDPAQQTKEVPWDAQYGGEEPLSSFLIEAFSGLVSGESESNSQAEPEPIREKEGAESATERPSYGRSAPGSNYTCSTFRWE